MRAPRKTSALVLAAITALLAVALAVAGCGGGSDGGGSGEPASVIPATATVYVEANLAPETKVREDLDQLAQTVFGVGDVGEFIADELEKEALGEGEKLDFEEEVEPWLGEKIALYLNKFKNGNFVGEGVAVALTDAGEAEEFLEEHAEKDKGEVEEGEFEGVKYFLSGNGEVSGVVGDYLVYGKDKSDFEKMVETESAGNGLNESPKFTQAMEAASEDGIGRVYVDIGGIIEQGKAAIGGEAEAVLDLVQIEPRKATLVGSVLPQSGQVELDLSTDLGKSKVPAGDASKLLESLPATAVLGFASSEFGKSFSEGVHGFSENGIPGQMEPGEFEAALETMGIDVEGLGEAFGDAGGFVEGSSLGNIGGAMVVETDNAAEASNLIAKIGLLLRVSGTKGVTAVNGPVTGFSVHTAKLGPQPLIVGSAGEEIVIAYGSKAAAQALRKNAKTLGTTPDFQAAKSSLGSTPISLFVDGGPGLKLAEGLLSTEERAELAQARPYLQKIDYVAVGSETKGQTQTAKVLIGLRK